MKTFMIFVIVFVVVACGPATPTPKWKENAYEQLELYKTGFLTGKEGSGGPHFTKSKREMASGNDLQLLSVAYLTKYALHVACLESFDPSEMTQIARIEPEAYDAAYLHFLKGDFRVVDARRLPVRYAGVLKAAAIADSAKAVREISAMEDPLSRLVACGVWIKYLTGDENLLVVCIDTASANGWSRPLWAYLSKLESLYLERGEKAKAEAVKERMNLFKDITSMGKNR